VYTPHADAPRFALCAARDTLFRASNEASRRSPARHFGSPSHTSSRCDPASFTYALDGRRIERCAQLLNELRVLPSLCE